MNKTVIQETARTNSTFSSIGSPAVASSPKPTHTARKSRNSKSLRFLCINFQSAKKKAKHIPTLVESARPDVILGTETWLSKDVNSSEIFDESLGFDVYRNDRADNTHGRVLIAVKKELNVTDVKCSKTVELISGSIQTKSKKIVFSSYYRPPGRTDEAYLESSRTGFLKLKADNKRAIIVIGGDFNVPDISWKDNTITSSKHYAKKVSQHYLDIASDLGAEQMVSFPTRKDNTLGLVLTSHPGFSERCKPLPPITEKSDHDIVLFDLAMQPIRARPKRRTIYLWKKANTDGIKKALADYGQSFLSRTFSTTADMWADFKSTIENVTQEFVPTRRTLAKHTHPWIDSHLRKLTRRRYRAFKKARRTNSPVDWSRYTKLRAQTEEDTSISSEVHV
ncbi:uncharacterized protein LOC128548696 [Mercenaria mercenaria]|uniref:uncharacterized protein LOC128548696 n=1 Tax=Mercenaria mercenaria TaxID=6596 RepID=UPI00234ED9A1|nr:uncharacterized protein LOC128548696 [Mercenaria mercenaria]